MKWLKKELLKLIPVTLFFFIIFSLADLTNVVMYRKNLGAGYNFYVVFMAALIMGKVVIISDKLPFIDAFQTKPLIWSTLWKTVIYVVLSFLIRCMERAVHHLLQKEDWSQIVDGFFHEVHKPAFWIGQSWLTMLVLIFVAYQELILSIGPAKVRKLFFGR